MFELTLFSISNKIDTNQIKTPPTGIKINLMVKFKHQNKPKII